MRGDHTHDRWIHLKKGQNEESVSMWRRHQCVNCIIQYYFCQARNINCCCTDTECLFICDWSLSYKIPMYYCTYWWYVAFHYTKLFTIHCISNFHVSVHIFIHVPVSCIYCYQVLTHWGLVKPFGDIDLGQHWLRYWLVAWRHQAITWTNVDLSSARSSYIHLMVNLREIHPPSVKSVKLTWKLLI